MFGFIIVIIVVIFLMSTSMRKQNNAIDACRNIVKKEREHLEKLDVEFTSEKDYINVTQNRGILFVVDDKEKIFISAMHRIK